MFEYNALGSRMTHALNHRRMIHGIRKENASREFRTEGGKCCIIGYVAGREDQCCWLAV